MRRHSPYNYAFNNPVNFIDSDGMAPSCTGNWMDNYGHWEFDPNTTIMGGDWFQGQGSYYGDQMSFWQDAAGGGAGVWWTVNQFTSPSTGYTTIADPGAGYRNLKTEDNADEDKDVNGQDVPSWAKEQGEAPYVDEDGKTFAERLLNGQYGKGEWNKSKASKGPGSEFNKIKKWGDRGFEVKKK